MARQGLPEEISKIIIGILKKHDVERISVFGSFARGEAGPESDIDILVRFTRGKSLFQLVKIEDELRNVLKRNVDLVTEQSLNPYLSDAIYRDVKVIYEAPGHRIPSPYP